MNVMYNSENYYVVEFPGLHGIELVDKTTGRAGFLDGAVEMKFRASMADLAAASRAPIWWTNSSATTTPC